MRDTSAAFLFRKPRCFRKLAVSGWESVAAPGPGTRACGTVQREPQGACSGPSRRAEVWSSLAPIGGPGRGEGEASVVRAERALFGLRPERPRAFRPPARATSRRCCDRPAPSSLAALPCATIGYGCLRRREWPVRAWRQGRARGIGRAPVQPRPTAGDEEQSRPTWRDRGTRSRRAGRSHDAVRRNRRRR